MNETPMVVERSRENPRVTLHTSGSEIVSGTFHNHDGIPGGPSLTPSGAIADGGAVYETPMVVERLHPSGKETPPVAFSTHEEIQGGSSWTQTGVVKENLMVVAQTLDNHRVPLSTRWASTVGVTFINRNKIQDPEEPIQGGLRVNVTEPDRRIPLSAKRSATRGR